MRYEPRLDEPQDVSEVGPTPYTYLFADADPKLVKKIVKAVEGDK